jgi:hypothetical protein
VSLRLSARPSSRETHRLAVDGALVMVALRRRLAYKSSWLIGLILGGGGLLIGIAVWHHLIGDGELGGYDWAAMKAYLIIGFVTATLAYGGADWTMADRILDGMISIDLTKPVDFQRARAAEFIAGLNVPVFIYHLGDYDPSGVNAAEKIESVRIGRSRRVPAVALEEYVARLRAEQNDNGGVRQ